MLTVKHQPGFLNAAVYGEFTLGDYKEFEENVLYMLRFHGDASLLLDLREMLGYTVDMAWEEIRFVREHRQDFARIAVVTSDQWLAWLAWLSRLYVDSDMRLFETAEEAEAWLNEAGRAEVSQSA